VNHQSVYFLDTSALVKRYHVEVGSEYMHRLFDLAEGSLSISFLTVVEIHSVFARKVRVKELTLSGFTRVVERFANDVRKGELTVVPFDDAHQKRAVELLKKHAPTRALRTLDALQLAVAVDLMEHGRLGTFVVADETLASVATQEGATALNPETVEQMKTR